MISIIATAIIYFYQYENKIFYFIYNLLSEYYLGYIFNRNSLIISQVQIQIQQQMDIKMVIKFQQMVFKMGQPNQL